ncbi:MAG: HprK-related kinase B [Hydrogenovibrio sp.]|uniref:HprK-related kinase B n=1 Tax=Hydrogenovibrio sp. TaxID=2065821 RepID=UPI00286FF540|nr:HprK-related kinase B [Hydrogenovibrio sp.]MDR9498451.1 HprK-related kinase B [Hydrogenovibrio sp.]
MNTPTILTHLNALRHRLKTAQASHAVTLQLPQMTLRIRTDQAALAQTLSDYFAPCLIPQAPTPRPDLEILALESSEWLTLGENWQDWQREPGKSGRKDAIFDFNDEERFVYKVKTGMVFWQNPDQPTAIGPVNRHPNQVINFALTQYLNHHLNQGWQLGHCAALTVQNQGLAIAGLSGGGKSTLMLHLLELGQAFVSNDRLLIRPDTTRPGQFCMRGIPKWPRVNPGTLLHNRRLKAMLSPHTQAELSTMPADALRQLEDKYDVPVQTFYGDAAIRMEAPLNALIVLDWGDERAETTRLNVTTLKDAPELVAALAKSPGPFYAQPIEGPPPPDGKRRFLPNGQSPSHSTYLAMLGDLPCWVLQGRWDFEQAVALIRQQLER